MGEYEITITAPGVIETKHTRYGVQRWIYTALKRAHKCANCGRAINAGGGGAAYMPQTTGANRSHRICGYCSVDKERD